MTLEAPGERRLAVDGVFGLVWRDGRGILGHVLQASPDGTVTRQFHDAAGTPLKEGELTAFDSRVYGDDPLRGRGVSFEDISLRGELGDYPAWLIPGRRSTWFIFVHGNAMTRLDGLRVLSTVVEAEMPMLIPTYRGDEQAPAPGDGHLTYGKREWRDIETAVQYALDHGAESVVLEGVSMGGAIVTAFLLESPLAAKVSGVILDAPVLSFREAVEFQAGRERLPLIGLPLPGTLVDVARWLASARFDVDWDYTDYLDRIGRLVTPILLIHGAADRDVPLATSQQLASARPDLVTDFYVATGAGHVEAWNVDPDEYERRLLKFLRVIGALD